MTWDVPSALVVDHLSLKIGGADILREVSLDVPHGSLVGVIGPNGAGKTTLFNAISGLVQPTGGRVAIQGKDVTRSSVAARAKAGLGRTFQTSSLFPRLTVLENVRLAAETRQGKSYSIFRFPNAADPSTKLAQETLERVGIAHVADTKAADISHGDKRKLEIAVLLVTDASLVLLDEPMAGVASGDIEGLVNTIRQMHTETGCTVLMVEHHIDVLLGLVKHVAVMNTGSIIAYGTPQEVMAEEIVQTAYLGTVG